jgi:hypothetical protein
VEPQEVTFHQEQVLFQDLESIQAALEVPHMERVELQEVTLVEAPDLELLAMLEALPTERVELLEAASEESPDLERPVTLEVQPTEQAEQLDQATLEVFLTVQVEQPVPAMLEELVLLQDQESVQEMSEARHMASVAQDQEQELDQVIPMEQTQESEEATQVERPTAPVDLTANP